MAEAFLLKWILSLILLSFFYLLPLHDRDSTEGIPEGFFDDPKLDAKVR